MGSWTICCQDTAVPLMPRMTVNMQPSPTFFELYVIHAASSQYGSGVSSVAGLFASAGYMQWKQLLVLFLGCISGPLDTHTQLFTAFLTTLTAQLQIGFGMGTHSSATGTAAVAVGAKAASTADTDVGMLGAGLVDELLPDSFLKQAFRGFFEVLQESADQAPAGLLAQVRCLAALTHSHA